MDTSHIHPYQDKEPRTSWRIRKVVDELRHFRNQWDFRDTPMGDDGMAYLAHYASPGPYTVHTLDLVRCGLGDDSVDALIGLIGRCKELRNLHLRDNHFTAAGLDRLLQGVAAASSTITNLDISDMPLGPEGGKAVARFLAVAPQLDQLTCRNNQLGAGFADLAQALPGMGRLQRLDVQNNGIPLASANDWLPSLRANRSLVILRLADEKTPEAEQLTHRLCQLPNANLQQVGNISIQRKNTPKYQGIKKKFGTIDPFRDRPSGSYLREVENQRALLKWEFHPTNKPLSDIERYVAESVPGLPESPQNFIEAFLRPASGSRAYAPADHPQLYTQSGRLLSLLEQADPPLTRSDLTRETPAGTSLICALANAIPPMRLIPFLNSRGIAVGGRELLDSEGKGNEALDALCLFGGAESFLTRANLSGMSGEEFRAIRRAMPDYAAQEIRFGMTLFPSQTPSGGRTR